MGLLICHKIAESLKGTIVVQSKINSGSTFSLTFNADKAVIRAKASQTKDLSPSTRRRKKQKTNRRRQKSWKKSGRLHQIEEDESEHCSDVDSIESFASMERLQNSVSNLFYKSFDENNNEFVGRIIIADDQMLNLQILKSYFQRMQLEELCDCCIDG